MVPTDYWWCKRHGLDARLPEDHRLHEAHCRHFDDGPEAKVYMTMGEAWAEATAAIPTGWRPITLRPDDDWQPSGDGPGWTATTCSMTYFEGECDDDDELAYGSGPTPVAALHDLATKLHQRIPEKPRETAENVRQVRQTGRILTRAPRKRSGGHRAMTKLVTQKVDLTPDFVEVDLTELQNEGVLLAANERFFWPLGLALTWMSDGGQAHDLHVRQWTWPDGHREAIGIDRNDTAITDRRKRFKDWVRARIQKLPEAERGLASIVTSGVDTPWVE